MMSALVSSGPVGNPSPWAMLNRLSQLRLPDRGWLSLAARTLVIFIPAAIAAALGLGLVGQAERQALDQAVENNQQRIVEVALATIAGHLSAGIADIGFLAAEQQLQRWLADASSANTAALAEQYLTFMRHNEEYDKLRLIGADGRDVIRIDRDARGKVTIAPPSDLQDWSTADFFADAMTLPRGSVFVSPLELNIEHGRIQTPLDPTFRYSAPVFDIGGHGRGAIVLNYHAQTLLDDLESQAKARGGALWLIDRQGEWLLGPSRDVEWGALFPEREAESFAHTYPAAWKAIGAGNGTGNYRSPQGLFTFGSTTRLAGVNAGQLGTPGAVLTQSSWYAISRMSPADYARFYEQRGTVSHPVWWAIMAALAVICAGFGYHWHRRVRADLLIHHLNAQLERDNHALTAVNKELEAFSYSVSHDLRTPLRSIDGFCQALLEDYSDKVDDVGRDYLARVRKSAQRMGELIDDILALSRVSRANVNPRPIDITALAREVQAEACELDPARTVQWHIAEGLAAEGDAKLVQILLDNLVGNAFKFTARTEAAVIEIGAEEQAEGQVLFVRDNGAGFDMAYADKLFGAFQRLHSAQEYPGTGIGLATAQRIVTKHGGRIWASAEPGKGATFYFTLGRQSR
jgi:signal transduction histidine kinase